MSILETCAVEGTQQWPSVSTSRVILVPTSSDDAILLEEQSTHTIDLDLVSEDAQKHADILITPLCIARISDSAKTVTVSRLPHRPSFSCTYDTVTPYSSFPPTVVSSRAPSPTKGLYADNSLHWWQRFSGVKWRLASGFFTCFMCGWGDGVTGTVLPHLNKEFHLRTTLSSSLFAGTTCGFFAGTFIVETLLKYFGSFRLKHDNNSSIKYSHSKGRHLLLLFSSILYALYFVMMGSRSGFPAMFVAYILAAFSKALLTAPLNAYFASGPKQALGYSFGLTSLGSVVSPLMCQVLIASGVPWFHFYFGSLVLSGLSIMSLLVSFRPTSKELIDERHAIMENIKQLSPSSTITSSSAHVSNKSPTSSALRLALHKPYQWAFSLFALLYCGSETTTQGFMVTFLLKSRHANPRTVGYVTSGFWGGITLGRFLWGYLTPYLSFQQRKFAIQANIGIAIAMHLVIWFVGSNVVNSVATSIIGVLYGPIFPATFAMANDILPLEVHMVAMSIIASFASLGGAIFPLVVGAVLDAKGTQAFTYITVPTTVALAAAWALFPPRVPRIVTSTV